MKVLKKANLAKALKLFELNFDDLKGKDTAGIFEKIRQSYKNFPAHWDPKLRIPRGQVVAAASIVSPKY